MNDSPGDCQTAPPLRPGVPEKERSEFSGWMKTGDPRFRHQKIRQVSTCRIFLSKPQAWHIITARSVVHIISPFGAVSHHALACIYLRLDDIQNFVLMICNSCGIDDIHGFRRDLCKSSNSYAKTAKISFFVAHSQEKRLALASLFLMKRSLREHDIATLMKSTA